MAVVSVVKLSELEGAKRIDAEYYKPEYLETKDKLINLQTKTTQQISESVLSFGAYSLCNYIVWRESGIPYLKAENVYKGYIDFSETKFIDDGVHNILHKSQVKEEQVLVSMSGTTGNVAVAYKIPPKLNSNQDIAKITLKQGYSPYCVAAFLNSKYGQLQIEREIVGSVQQHVFLGQIKQFRVPILAEKIEKEVEKIYKNGLDKLALSKSVYTQAENLLLEELGLKDFTPKYLSSYTTKLSKAFGVHRVDAEYFQPAYDELIENLMNFEVKKLGKLAYRKRIKINPDPDKNYGYIEISDISTDIGEINYSERPGKELPPNARIPIDRGELIISKVRPTRGAIGIIPKGLNKNVICSSAFSVFTAQSPLKEYLYIISRSIIGRLQMERPTTGTSYPTINDKDVENIKVPILSDEIQQKIASHVQQLHEARRKAKELLEDAKRKVEGAIENKINK